MIDQIWAQFAVESCIRSGIDHFFVAPGSRCTPLTLAIANHSDARVIQHFDERGLAFSALGYGKATGRPAVFVCTSGTAVANAFPAVIEAAMEKVPLLLFTADRPPELKGVGANQTIEQQNIFGDYPQQFINMAVPEDQHSADDENGITYLSSKLVEGLEAAGTGPVHFNWMFREPFTIEQISDATIRVSSTEPVSVQPARQESELQIELDGSVVIALGRCRKEVALEVQKLATTLNAPLLTDVTSGLSQGSLELPSEFSLPVPDTVLHFGGRIVSKTWHQWTNSLRDSATKFIHVTSDDLVVNPNQLDQQRFVTTLDKLESRISGVKVDSEFTAAWLEASRMRNVVVTKHLESDTTLSEPSIAFYISKTCPSANGLFVGNSMVIRDLDWFGVGNSSEPLLIASNRGASGIDGLIATAVGFAEGLQKPTTVVLGDLSALHDLNSLALVAKSQYPLVVLVINNHGGHIFDLLPIKKSDHFEKFFATPHSIEFGDAARMFGLKYQGIRTLDELRASYEHALSSNQSVLLELFTDRNHNLSVRQQIREEICKCSTQL
ncbi:MAG: 2-succinyl-5-enolpyruvyl-6-hydroxy-3-cyclohexene-1-carboxylic-acid synthase [Planctomycetota bacterium]